MRSAATAIEYRRLRAPQGDRTVLIEPPPDELGAVVDRNVRDRASEDCDVQGRSLATLRQQARREMLVEAGRWVAGHSDVGPAPQHSTDDAAGLIFLAGHQPGLFHPGVWAKNFALDALARRHGAVAVNLLIDSDTAKDTSVRVPGGSPSEPTVEAMVLDRPEPRIPYELRSIVDRAGVRRLRPSRGPADRAVGGRSADRDLLAVGARADGANGQSGDVSGAGPPPAGDRLGAADARDSAEPIVPGRAVLLVRGPPVGAAPTTVGHLQRRAGRVSPGTSHAKRGASGARPGPRRRLVRDAAMDRLGRRSPPPCALRPSARRPDRVGRPPAVWSGICRLRPRATPPGPSDD